MANDNISSTDATFIVSKSELLLWVNSLLNLNLTKIEQMASGAAYCQILDAIYPCAMPMTKVNWAAKFEHEYLNNYKLVKFLFDKNKINKTIEAQKLIKGKYQDHFELLKWLRRFADTKAVDYSGYQAVQRRKATKTPWDVKDTNESSKIKINQSRASLKTPLTKGLASPRALQAKEKPKLIQTTFKSDPEDLKKLESLAKEVKELEGNLEKSEFDRKFYFEKLRLIEIYCDHHEDIQNPYLLDIQQILFASSDSKIFMTEKGTISIS